jgi:hypothetical protein
VQNGNYNTKLGMEEVEEEEEEANVNNTKSLLVGAEREL